MVVVGALRIILVILAFNGGLLDRSVFSVFSGVAPTQQQWKLQ